MILNTVCKWWILSNFPIFDDWGKMSLILNVAIFEKLFLISILDYGDVPIPEERDIFGVVEIFVKFLIHIKKFTKDIFWHFNVPS